MAREEKPYRVYRGGRVKGRVPLQSRPERTAKDGRDGKNGARDSRSKPPRRRTKWTKKTWIGITLGLILVVLVAWGVASYIAFQRGVDAANKRLKVADATALDHQGGLLLSHATNILLLGTD